MKLFSVLFLICLAETEQASGDIGLLRDVVLKEVRFEKEDPLRVIKFAVDEATKSNNSNEVFRGLIVRGDGELAAPPITLSLKNVPLGHAIKIITENSGLEYRWINGSLVIADKSGVSYVFRITPNVREGMGVLLEGNKDLSHEISEALRTNGIVVDSDDIKVVGNEVEINAPILTIELVQAFVLLWNEGFSIKKIPHARGQ